MFHSLKTVSKGILMVEINKLTSRETGFNETYGRQTDHR